MILWNYLFEGGKRNFLEKFLCQILIHLFLSDAKSAVRPAIVLFENYSYLFILLGGRRQKCLWTKIFSLVLLIQKRLWTKTFHTSAHRRFRQVRSDRISSKYTFLSESTDVFVIVHSCIKKKRRAFALLNLFRYTFLSADINIFVGQHTRWT